MTSIIREFWWGTEKGKRKMACMGGMEHVDSEKELWRYGFQGSRII
jgi:hypothetical protein